MRDPLGRRRPLLLLTLLLFGLAAVPARADEPARRLSPDGLRNLEAFARLLGAVRFFQPSDQVAAADWDRVAIAGVQRLEDARGPEELAARLQDFFAPLAPTLRVYAGDVRPPLPAELLPPAGAGDPTVIYWFHHGVQLPLTFPNTYRSRRLTAAGAPPASSGLPMPAAPLELSLGRGVSALLPLTLYKDAAGTLPHTSLPAPEPDEPAGWVPSGNDRATRLAGVALGWSVLQSFYPYFDVVDADWPAELRRALETAATDADERAFVDTLRRMMAGLDDGHARVTHRSWNLDYQLPLVWVWLDERLVISWADPAAAPGLGAGDTVLAIDGRPAPLVYREELALAPGATPQHLRSRALQRMLLGPRDQEVRLRVQKRDGGVREVAVRRTSFVGGTSGDFLTEPRPEKVAELSPGIFYLDVNRINDDDFFAVLDQLAMARGIIFDLRGYPWELSDLPLYFLASEPVRGARFEIPDVYFPDRQGWTFGDIFFPIGPFEPHINAKVAWITDGRAVSYSETYMGIVEHYKLGEIVGEATAGTNGTVNFISLPGGYTLRFTGMRVRKHDGSQHHGVGLRPTVPVARTLEGVRAGRDEFLEKAIEVVSRP